LSVNSVEFEKLKIRQIVLDRLKNQPFLERRRKSDLILSQLSRFIKFKKNRVVMFYVSMLEEVDTLPLLKTALQEGCTVTIPFVDQANKSLLSVRIENPETDLVRGSYGILEPKKHLVNHFDVNQLEAVLVPGIAFDRKGHRLGRGKGYYDRFLKSLPKNIKTIGLAYDFQLMDLIPVNDLDIAVQQVITN